MIVTRFAPSPTGLLHLGHAYSALLVYGSIKKGGDFLLRIEDIDPGRCRIEYEKAIEEDLNWLGIKWQKPVRRQSEHMHDYASALNRLDNEGLLYPCFCTRKEIIQARSSLAMDVLGPDGPIYPGSCRGLNPELIQKFKNEKKPFAWRLDMQKAVARVGELTFRDLDKGLIVATPEIFGDVVLARKETPTSYHLAVCVDDHIQGINMVIRGQDLFPATHIHRLLQALLGLDTPSYRHHRLLLDESGKKFAKRERSPSLQELRLAGATPKEIFKRVGLG
ncbi:MAG: tRNA glutamyl-Q(34) synthetase GluQRS [Magnetococcales bacterium]|nr:tRNA glutamyl-Q(34) synthetase GluQRS [Magnetococcales bacterium]